ncbi:hypothetical protein HFO56_23430 [Rhizobium laguerreae]|uniref:hypothetical protein n=1 Tax=Rhizobium laguerreae TaxID=1076926 RepID=UPI001C926874|nr:hypothetical protein [Rhizobium laguerreae]MBY3155278.1 hypothetical protein [Rhizobium laguerreae]
MTKDTAAAAIEYSSPIEFLYDGKIVDPALVFGAARRGRSIEIVRESASRKSLRRQPKVFNVDG